MKTIMTCSFALWSIVMPLGRPQASCCRLEVATSTTNPGELALTVTVTNLQEIPVHVRQMGAAWDIRVKIVPSDGGGGPPELTQHGKQVLRERSGSMQKIELKRGEMYSQTLDVDKLYVLKTGYYSVTVDRDVFIDDNDHRITLEAKTAVGVS